MKKINVINITLNGESVNLLDALRGIRGHMGSRLNPVQDINGDWFVSQEEWDNPEFDEFKQRNQSVLAQFEDAEFIPEIKPFK